jgi:cholesterol transport system auxiliary component
MRKLPLALGLLLLQSCVSVLPKASPPSARYQVTDVTVADLGASPVSWTLAVDEPEATLAFDTAKIAISREPARIEYYAGGQWVDRAPRLFSAALVRSFENTGVIRGVGNRVTLPVSTYVLQTDIRKLTIDQASGRNAEVAVFARLTNGRSKMFATRLFTATSPVSADNADAAASALNAGLQSVQREIVAWTIAEGSAASAN